METLTLDPISIMGSYFKCGDFQILFSSPAVELRVSQSIGFLIFLFGVVTKLGFHLKFSGNDVSQIPIRALRYPKCSPISLSSSPHSSSSLPPSAPPCLPHALDSSAPDRDEQREAVLQVLQQIGVSKEKLQNMIEVWNKIDIEEDKMAAEEFDEETKTRTGVKNMKTLLHWKMKKEMSRTVGCHQETEK